MILGKKPDYGASSLFRLSAEVPTGIRTTTTSKSLRRNHMDIMSLIIQLIAGAVGGNAAGALLKNFSLGTAGNSIAGVIGGGIGGQILSAMLGGGGAAAGAAAAGGGVLGSLAGGGIGGAILMIIIGIIKGVLAKK
jgi:hypothetical protein